ncbi:hypothetical protein BHM03_00049840 [Ensete ventricosum]|nr:hypothetical protein BHM03_00049840 [Ensete ventricosum]
MEALLAVKDMFPRISNSELMAPVDNVIVSTEKLRQRLLEEGMSEGAIQDTEQIMRSEFASLQDQVVLLKQKQILLLDTLRQLEVSHHPMIVACHCEGNGWNGKTVATLIGKWDDSMHYMVGDVSGKSNRAESFSEAQLLWKCSKPAKHPTRYNLTRFAITLNELTPGLKVKHLVLSHS